MIEYASALSVAESYYRSYHQQEVFFSWDGTPVRRIRYQEAEWDAFKNSIYETLARVYAKQHEFDSMIFEYVVEYLRMRIPVIDALTMYFAMTVNRSENGSSLQTRWLDDNWLFDEGFAEWIDSYLAGVPLEHILA